MELLWKPISTLTELETNVIRLTAEGCKVAEIASQLHYSPAHIRHILDANDPNRGIFRKIEGVTNREQLIQWWGAGQSQEQLLRLQYDQIEEELRQMAVLRKTGTTGIISLVANRIDHLRTLRGQLIGEKIRIDRLTALAILEWFEIALQTSLSHEIVQLSKPYLALLETVTYAVSNDPERYEMIQLMPSRIEFVAGDMAACRLRQQALFPTLTTSRGRAISVRTVVVATGTLMLNRKISWDEGLAQFNKDEEIALGVLGKSAMAPQDRATLYEGLSLLRGRLKLPHAQEFYDKANAEYALAFADQPLSALAQTQLLRTGFSNLINQPDVDIDTVIRLADRSLRHFEKAHHVRYSAQVLAALRPYPNYHIQDYLRDILNVRDNKTAWFSLS